MKSTKNLNLIIKYQAILDAAYDFWKNKNSNLNYEKNYEVIEFIPYYLALLVVSTNNVTNECGCVFINNDSYEIINLTYKQLNEIKNK